MTKTSCDWIVERLPWWANDTLEEGEAERVAAHLDECAACRAELAATRQAMALYGAHLPVETLLDLAAGGVGAADEGGPVGGVSRATIQAHLGHCAACREELSLLRESRAAVVAHPDEAGATVTAFAPRRAAAAPGAGARRRFDRRAVALAASVLIAVVAAGGWLLTGRVAGERGEQLAELERRLAAVAAEQPADRPAPDAAPPGEGAAAETEAALAAREAEIERLRREIARLEAEAEAEAGEGAAGERTAALVGSGVGWDVRSDVLRGADDAAAAEADEVDAGAGTTFSYFVTGAAVDRPLRLTVEKDGRVYYEARAPSHFEVGSSGPHVMFSLPLAELPAGRLLVRLFSGGEELGSRSLVLKR